VKSFTILSLLHEVEREFATKGERASEEVREKGGKKGRKNRTSALGPDKLVEKGTKGRVYFLKTTEGKEKEKREEEMLIAARVNEKEREVSCLFVNVQSRPKMKREGKRKERWDPRRKRKEEALFILSILPQDLAGGKKKGGRV